MATESIIKCKLCTNVQHGDKIWSHRVQLPPTPGRGPPVYGFISCLSPRRFFPPHFSRPSSISATSPTPLKRSASVSSTWHVCSWTKPTREFKKEEPHHHFLFPSAFFNPCISLLLLFKVLFFIIAAKVTSRKNKSFWNSSHTPLHLKIEFLDPISMDNCPQFYLIHHSSSEDNNNKITILFLFLFFFFLLLLL